jgi:hypothetical protein
MDKLRDLLKLTAEEESLKDDLLNLREDELLELMKLLQGERVLEAGIYAAREQWLWVPWTTCLAGAFVAVTMSNPVIAVGGPLCAGIIALSFALLRKPGLEASYDALNMRHKWVVALADRAPSSHLRLKTLGFTPRLLEERSWLGGSVLVDATHVGGFKYPTHLRSGTVVIFLLLAALGALANAAALRAWGIVP